MNLLKIISDACWFVPVSPLLERLEHCQNLHVSKTRNGYTLINMNRTPVNDLWIAGKPGEKINIGNGRSKVIGSSGLANIETIQRTFDDSTPGITQLKLNEKYRLIINQIILLIIRHLHGRKIKRIGW